MGLPTTGKNWILRIYISASPTAVAAQRGLDLDMNADEIDASSKDDNGWKRSLPGLKKFTINTDSLVIQDDAAYQALLDAFAANPQTEIDAEVTRPDGKVFRGPANITSFPHSAPYDDAATWSITLAGAGAPTKFWQAA